MVLSLGCRLKGRRFDTRRELEFGLLYLPKIKTLPSPIRLSGCEPDVTLKLTLLLINFNNNNNLRLYTCALRERAIENMLRDVCKAIGQCVIIIIMCSLCCCLLLAVCI